MLFVPNCDANGSCPKNFDILAQTGKNSSGVEMHDSILGFAGLKSWLKIDPTKHYRFSVDVRYVAVTAKSGKLAYIDAVTFSENLGDNPVTNKLELSETDLEWHTYHLDIHPPQMTNIDPNTYSLSGAVFSNADTD
jgi:hypothetical protein